MCHRVCRFSAPKVSPVGTWTFGVSIKEYEVSEWLPSAFVSENRSHSYYESGNW